ncbi:LuxR C-terminal-related transcriptional regulator [Amycolatopsis rhabdoformis]|uniref:LuxR C-terminal-related transcriptional regulator n=1 Tax=Amycolatopsis rhabdoformis TaxID=1448059 RepID=A0ABZ1IJ97_9PSEU|nr:LuxR C-terminal-related transcriptional regulator [Amycolatopsis rhabdoformis]WSE34254.1 LuxR C-terminal-related transcriptional regulator [Amycolatopsis rhabdoformis]
MWDGLARGVRRDIAALAVAGLGVAELHEAALELVDRVVPTDLACWASLDPDTAVISSMTSGRARIPHRYEPLLAAYEYDGAEPHTFAELARRPMPVAGLADLPRRDLARSRRFAEVWRPLGLSHELRATFRADGVPWAAAGLVRRGGFSDREVEFVLAVAPAVAAATRVAARCGGPAVRAEPAIVVVGADARIRAATPAAREWQSRLDEVAPGRFEVLVHAVTAGTRAAGSFRARVRDASGGWLVLHGSALVADEGATETVVTVDRASAADLLGVLFAAYDLTIRERELCHEVLAGQSTSDIAARLAISPHTVRDHLKSVYAKLGVRSRGELVARLWPADGPPAALPGPTAGTADQRTTDARDAER